MTDPVKRAKAESLERPKAGERGAYTGRRSGDELSVRRKLAEAAPRDSEERLRAILETAVEGIITDERFASEAVEVAAAADLIVVAMARASDPPPEVNAWLEKSLTSARRASHKPRRVLGARRGRATPPSTYLFE